MQSYRDPLLDAFEKWVGGLLIKRVDDGWMKIGYTQQTIALH